MELLTKNKPFRAFFLTQFLGAFNDNFFRTSFVTLVTYHLVSYAENTKALFVSAAFGLFMLPAFLCSLLAGQLADRYDKSRIIQWVKVSEVLIVSASAYGFIHKNPYFLLVAVFCMGVHASFFGPVKYSILPDILLPEDVLNGNGYIEAGTFLAIMGGTLCGALMIHLQVSPFFLTIQLLAVAIGGFVTSWFIPRIPSSTSPLKRRRTWRGELRRLYRYAYKEERVYRAIIAISWFWLVGTVLLSQLPPFAKEVIKVEESVFIFLLLLFTVGIGLGSLLCNWVFKSEITTKYVPLLSFLMIPLLYDLSCFTEPFAENPTSLFYFFISFQGLRLSFDILALSFVGGLFIVPLYAFIQTHVASGLRSQVLAFNNIINAGFMVFASVASFCLLSLNISIPTLIFLTALGQIAMTIYVIRILPYSLFDKQLDEDL